MQQAPDLPLDLAVTPASEVAPLAIPTLSPEKYVAAVYRPFKDRLTSAIDSVRTVNYDITTTAGMRAAIECRAKFRDLRVEADKERKVRKEPINKIGKLLESGFDGIEERIAPLEEMFDADIRAEEKRKADEKAEKARIEAARVAAIRAKIDAILALPAEHVGKGSTDLTAALTDLAQRAVTEEEFAELASDATLAIETVATAMITMREKALEREEAERVAEAARKAEAERLAAERAELERLRAEQAERERVAKAEAGRIAAEQAAEARRLAEERRKQEAELQRERDAEAARVRAEEEARAAAAAEQQRILAQQQADLEEQRAAFAREQEETRARAEAAARLDSDHAEALPMNAQFDADREAGRARLQALADQAATDARERADTERKAGLPAGSLRNIPVEGPSDREIIDLIAATFDLTFADAIERVEAIVFDELREAA